MADDRPLEGRIALVTGASRGLGYAAALGLAKAGAHVIATARTVGGLEELDDEIREIGGSTTLVPLDITDYDGIDRLGGAIHERWGRLDALLGNAGELGVITPVTHMAPKDFDKVMAVNVTANWRLMRSTEPLLRASDAGRALFVSSGAVQSRRPFTGPYAASKAALETLVTVWAKEMAKSSVRANLLDPATVRTRMRAKYRPGEDPKTVPAPETVVPAIVSALSPVCDRNAQIWRQSVGTWEELDA